VTDRPDPIEAWRDVSASVARSTGYRAGRAAHRWSGLASIGAMTVALAIVVVGLALRPATSGIGTTGPVSAAADDGIFRLELMTPRGTYEPGYPIAPVASLTYLGPDGAITVQHDTSPVQFRIEEVGGSRATGGGSRLICGSTNLIKDAPLDVPFAKAGSPTDDPAAGFDQAWYADQKLTLPIGTWRIVASIDLGVGGCTPSHHLSVANTVRVVASTGDGPVVDVAQDDAFRLELTTPRRTYTPTDAIDPVATVTFLGPAAETSIHHGGSIVGFDIEEVDGSRTLYGGTTAVCATSTIRGDMSPAFPFTKSGPIGGAFDRAWFDDPALHLPVGTWRIHAYTTITTDDGPAPSDGSFTCGTKGHGLEATNVITVAGNGEPSPSPIVAPSPSITASSPEPTANTDPVSRSVDDGVFQLTLTTPQGTSGPEDAIQPIAAVTYLGPSAETTMYHASSPVGFRIDEIGGTRQMGGAMALPCLHTAARKDMPLPYPFEKAGMIGQGFDEAWYRDPVLHLPVGVWRIRAYLDIDLTDGTTTCGGTHHHLEVENLISVVDVATTGPAPSVSADGARAVATVEALEAAVAANDPDAAWALLSPWSQTAMGSRAFYDTVVRATAADPKPLVVGPPSQDPDLLSVAFLGDRANDITASADMSRAFVVSVRDPSTNGAAAATTNLVAAPLLADGTWRVWLDASSGG
jgi:hypothetical protein